MTAAAQRIGRRGAALLFFAFLDYVYGFALLTAPRPLGDFYTWMDGKLPMSVWAALWVLVGTICLVYSFRTYDTAAFMFAVSLKVAWGLMAFWGWVMGAVDRGWVSAVIWLAFAWFVFLIAGGIPPAARRTAPWRRPRWTPS